MEGLSVFSVCECVTSTIGPRCLQRMQALPINPGPGAGVSSRRGDNSQHKSTLRYVGTWKRPSGTTCLHKPLPRHGQAKKNPAVSAKGAWVRTPPNYSTVSEGLL